MTDYFASLIRTVVPILAGAGTSFLARKGLDIDEAEITVWLTPLLIGLYYAAIRKLEIHFPAFGWLLGLAKQPGYPAESAPVLPSSTGVDIDHEAVDPDHYPAPLESERPF